MSDLIDREALLRQIDIDSEGEPGYYGDTWKFIDTIKRMPSALSTNLAEVGTDAISRQKAINALYEWEFDNKDERDAIDVINGLQSIQPVNCSEFPNNSDAISRQAAIDALCNDYCGGHQDCKYYPNCENLKSIEQLPPAQPEIIRCRNCKFASGDSRICMKFGHSPIGELDFCAWAERRTDE